MNKKTIDKSPAPEALRRAANLGRGLCRGTRQAAKTPPADRPAAPAPPVRRGGRLVASSLAAIVLALGLWPSRAQLGPTPLLIPLASMFADGDTLSSDLTTSALWIGDDVTGLPGYLAVGNAGFFSDPPPSFPWAAAGGVFNVAPGPVAAPDQSLIFTAGIQGISGGAIVIGKGMNLVDVLIPCYWGGNGIMSGPPPQHYSGPLAAFGLFSHVHFEVRVEAADSVGFSPSAATYTAQAGWTVLATAALDVFNAAYDNPNTSYPGNPGLPDTVINLNADGSYSVTVPPMFPAASVSVPQPATGWNCYQWEVPVPLPQKVVNVLRVAVYASLYATPEDSQNGGYIPGRWFEFPDPLMYYGQLWPLLQPLSNPSYPSLDSLFEMANDNGYDDYDFAINTINAVDNGTLPGSFLPVGEVVTDQRGPAVLSSVQQVVGTVMSEPGDQHLWDYSPNMVVAVEPENLLPYDFLPYGIIYNPPGNYSGVAEISTASYSTIMSFTTSQGTSMQTADVQGTSFTLGAQASISTTYFSVPVAAQATWSSGSSTVNTTSDTTANTTTLSGSETAGYGLGSCSLNCTSLMPQGYAAGARNPTLWPLAPDATDATLGSPWNDAFWYDQIWIIPYPVFASWTLPSATGGTPIPTAQLVGFLQAGQLNAKAAIPYQVRCLYCAAQSQQYCWDDHWQFALSPDECAALLQMDPFFKGSTADGTHMWQGVKPSDVDLNRFIELRQFPVEDGQDGTFCLGQNSVVSWADNQTTSLANQQSASSGFTFNLNLAGSGANYSSSQSQQNGFQVSYSTQQGSSLGQAVTTCGVLRDNGTDIDPTTHKPKNPGGFAGRNVPDVYFDLTFGSFLVQDANEPPPDGTDYTSWPGFCDGCNVTPGPFAPILKPIQFRQQVVSPALSEGLALQWELEHSIQGLNFNPGLAGTTNLAGPRYWLPPGAQWPAGPGRAPPLPPPPGFPPPGFPPP